MKLQIEIDADVTGDGVPELKLTPIDVTLPDDAAKVLKDALTVADQFDTEPGDGEFDQTFKSKIPIHLGFFNTSFPINGKVTIRVKD